jgi:hypothetical protein
MTRLEEIQKEKEAIVTEAKRLSVEGGFTAAMRTEMILDMNILIDEEKELKAKVKK